MDFASLMMAEFPGIQPYNYASMTNHINTMNNQVMQQFNPVNGHDRAAFNAINAHERSSDIGSQAMQFSAGNFMSSNSRQFDDNNDAHQPFQCPTCFKGFSRQGQLSRHMQSHITGHSRHLNTTNKAQLAKHAQIHSDDFNKSLDGTNNLDLSLFENKDTSDDHIAEVKKEAEPVNAFLQMALETAKEMKEEQSKKERPYQCSTCLKRFLTKTHLKRHLRSKAHLTGQCQQAIVLESLPGEVRQVYGPNGAINGPPTPNRPFQCQICHKRFTTQNHLKRHGDVHFGVKRFSCDICHKTFLRGENLNIHKRTHSGLKPFKCSICGKGFSQPSNVKKHEKTHSKFKEYQCAICLKAFKIKCSLKAHMKTMHNTLI